MLLLGSAHAFGFAKSMRALAFVLASGASAGLGFRVRVARDQVHGLRDDQRQQLQSRLSKPAKKSESSRLRDLQRGFTNLALVQKLAAGWQVSGAGISHKHRRPHVWVSRLGQPRCAQDSARTGRGRGSLGRGGGAQASGSHSKGGRGLRTQQKSTTSEGVRLDADNVKALPGIPDSFLQDLEQRSGLKSLPVLDAGDAPQMAAELFHQHGIVAIRGALPEDLMKPLRAKCEIVIEDIISHDPHGLGSRGPKRYSFGGSSSTGSQLHHPEWAALVDVPPVTAVLDQIWKSCDYVCHTAGGDFCLSGAPGHQNLHADAWTEDCEQFPEPPYICVNYLLEDQTCFNGPLRAIPGTHRQDARKAPTVSEESAESILSTTCPLPAGTALVRDLRTWHGGTPNLSDHHRSMPNAEFVAPDVVKAGWQKFNPSIPYEVWESLSARGKAMTRFVMFPKDEVVQVDVHFDITLGNNPFGGCDLHSMFNVCRSVLES